VLMPVPSLFFLARYDLAGSCGASTGGYVDGAPLDARFDLPSSLAFTTDGEMFVVGEYGGNRVRAVVTCDNEVCPFGKWRGPCNSAIRGACLNCTKGTNALYTAAADPFNADACKWECLVGFYSTGPLECSACTNAKPAFSSYSANGGGSNACPWKCDAEYRQGTVNGSIMCIPIPPEECTTASYLDGKTGSCADGNFVARGCGRDAKAWEDALRTVHGPSMETSVNMDACKVWLGGLCDTFNGTLAVDVSKVCPSALCIMRGHLLEVKIGTCNSNTDCPGSKAKNTQVPEELSPEPRAAQIDPATHPSIHPSIHPSMYIFQHPMRCWPSP